MATGMVLIIVTRNIDLSVGSMLAAIGMAMALLQAEILPDIFGIGHPMIWIVSLAAGIAMGAAIGGLQGAIVAYVGVPSFIVTLGGLLIWRGVAWWMASGRTIAPMDGTFLGAAIFDELHADHEPFPADITHAFQVLLKSRQSFHEPFPLEGGIGYQLFLQ